MNKPTRKTFHPRPHLAEGGWASDDRRHAESAHQLLVELEAVCSDVLARWPLPPEETVRNAERDYPELYQLIRRRDRLSDSVQIFSAMAVEGFLNYYGVVRLGEEEFNAHFERMGIIPKLRVLLLVCDNLSVSTSDPIVKALEALAKARNSLVHPKTKEYPGYVPAEDRPGIPIPQAAREVVRAMNQFFHEFRVAIPAWAHLTPDFPKEK